MESKYFSSANENKNKEKTEINNDGINVNSEKKMIYFLLATDPRILMLFLIEEVISLNIIRKKINNKAIFENNK